MKKRFCSLAAVLLLVLSMAVPAGAAEPRAVAPKPTLTFDGTTATCEVNIVADSSSERIEATVKLWQGGTCLKTWTDSATQYLRFSESTSTGIQAGKSYQMTVDYIIAGKSYPRVSASAVCRG